jgi:CubicO group peptidase (beta-lactamase class C family)
VRKRERSKFGCASNVFARWSTALLRLSGVSLIALQGPCQAADAQVVSTDPSVNDAIPIAQIPSTVSQGTDQVHTPANAKAGSSPSVQSDAGNFVQRADALVTRLVSAENVPGYAIAVIRNGNVIFKKGYGVTELERRGAAVDSQTVFGLASVTKTFTALALLMLVDQGKIKLDDPLSKYLSDLAPTWQKLTIRQLASMTAGIPKAIQQETTWPEEFKIVQREPLLSAPGSTYLYSNLSYRTLGSVIEAVTGKPYLDVLRELIIQPLGLTATGTQLTVQPSQLASPYVENQAGNVRRLPQYRDPSIPFSAGMLFSNLDDMVKYVQALMDAKLLSPTGYKTMWHQRPPLTAGEPSNWAFGWGLTPGVDYGNRQTVAMNGSIPGMAASVIIFPRERVAFISLANLRKKPVFQIVKKVAKLYWGAAGAANEGPEPGVE